MCPPVPGALHIAVLPLHADGEKEKEKKRKEVSSPLPWWALLRTYFGMQVLVDRTGQGRALSPTPEGQF